jgi:hypothetical protein
VQIGTFVFSGTPTLVPTFSTIKFSAVKIGSAALSTLNTGE